MYGAILQGSVAMRSSNVYSGTVSSDVSAKEMYLPQLLAAMLASPVPFNQPQEGWGFGFSGTWAVAQDFTGYVVSIATSVIDLVAEPGPQQNITVLGGLFSTGFNAQTNCHVVLTSQISGVPTLARNSGVGAIVLFDAESILSVVGGDASLLVEDTTPSGAPTIFAQTLYVSGPLTIPSASAQVGALCRQGEINSLTVAMSDPNALSAVAFISGDILVSGDLVLSSPGGGSAAGLLTIGCNIQSTANLTCTGFNTGLNANASRILFGTVDINFEGVGVLLQGNSDLAVAGNLSCVAPDLGQTSCLGIRATEESRWSVGGDATFTVKASVDCSAISEKDSFGTVRGNLTITADFAGADAYAINLDNAIFNNTSGVNASPSTCTMQVLTPGSNAIAVLGTRRSSATIDTLNLTSSAPGNMDGISAQFGSNIGVGAGLIQDCDAAVQAIFGSTVQCGAAVQNTVAGANVIASSVQMGAAVNTTFIGGAVQVGGSLTFVDDVVASVLGVAAAEGGVAAVGGSILTHTAYGVVAWGGRAYLNGDVIGDGVAVSVKYGGAVSAASPTLQSNTTTAVEAQTNGSFNTSGTALQTITAAADGVNCTGGGRAAFEDIALVAIVAGGNELVVGPGAGEQSTLAAALPNPGDGYSNAGASSSVSRLL